MKVLLELLSHSSYLFSNNGKEKSESEILMESLDVWTLWQWNVYNLGTLSICKKGSYTNQNFIGLFSSSYVWSELIMNHCLKKFSTLRRYQQYLKWILMFWNVYVIEINLNVKIIWRMLMQWQSLPQINMSKPIRIFLRLWRKPEL